VPAGVGGLPVSISCYFTQHIGHCIDTLQIQWHILFIRRTLKNCYLFSVYDRTRSNVAVAHHGECVDRKYNCINQNYIIFVQCLARQLAFLAYRTMHASLFHELLYIFIHKMNGQEENK